MRNSNVDMIAMTMLFISLAALYYAYVISPRDEALYAISECMGKDNSRESYDACAEKLRASHASTERN